MVLWYNGKMTTVSNFYQLSTATTIENSGTGTNVLTKPAGIEVASIVPGKKYSVFIPTAATFDTNFNSDVESFYISFYAKPEPGVLLSVAGNTVTYTEHSFVMENEVGDRIEIPERSRRAHLFMFAISDMEAGFSVDGVGDSLPADTLDDIDQMTVSLLQAGGIIDMVRAGKGQLTSSERDALIDSYNEYHLPPYETLMMFDENRDLVFTRTISNTISVFAGEVMEIPLEANECVAFKVEYDMVGEGTVVVNEAIAFSGVTLAETPQRITIITETGCVLTDVTITEYATSDMGVVGTASVSSELATGTPAPTHQHDDNAAAYGSKQIVLEEPAQAISAWVYANSDGAALPGVTFAGGKITSAVTGVYVNGKPYVANTTLNDWNFVTKVGEVVGEHTVDVPMHSLTVSPLTLTGSDVDDLYESFYGNPTYAAAEETITLSEFPALLISTEWSIVASG